jgi:transposase
MTKHGDVYLRILLIHGARSVLRITPKRSDAKSRWVESLRRRRPDNVAAVALAAKHARIYLGVARPRRRLPTGDLR